MTAHKDHAQLVVAQVLLNIDILNALRPGFERGDQLTGLAFKAGTAAQYGDRMVMRHAKEPCLRFFRNALKRPRLHCA